MDNPRKRTIHLLFPLLCMALAACQPDTAEEPATAGLLPAAGTTAPMPAPSATAMTAACETQDFDTFLRDFAEHPDVQRSAIVLPLRSESVDADAEPEPKLVVKWQALEDLKFPLMPSSRTQQQNHLQERRTAPDAATVEVMLSRPDTDDQQVYTFKRDRCWKLSAIRDDSL